jgi:phenylpyruvate tautomerase PptA (4-oxalocrotonate tautomerase family)
MPTYVVSTSDGILTGEVQQSVAELITTAHNEEMRGPRYLVQVLFLSIPPSSRYVGSRAAPSTQVWIRADVRSGGTLEQRTYLLQRLTREVAEACGISREDVWIYINELQAENMVEFGSILPSSGKEPEWLGAQSDELRTHLNALESLRPNR